MLPSGVEYELAEQNDLFEGAFDTSILLNDRYGVEDVAFVVIFGLDEFFEVESVVGDHYFLSVKDYARLSN